MDDLDLGATIKGFSPGQKVFDRYTLKKILGRGGMGVVWLAQDDKLEREVALKFLPEVMMGDKLALADLKRETRRSLDLTHSHIVRIYDFVEDGRTAAIAMEYIAGETLTNARADRPGHCYEPADIAKWVAQICDALDYAHTKAKVVHRDLKPANLMIDAAGDLKVTDFGIATSIADSVSRVSKQAGSSGTPVYMAPQQMMGDRPAVTDDIYSLGATLYELLTGKPPFYTGNVFMQVQNKVPPTMAERREELGFAGPAIPPEWEQTIAACLAKGPKDRPQSAGEVAERLGLAVRGHPQRPAAKPDPKVGRVSPPAPASRQSGNETPKSKMTAKAGVVGALILVGGLGWYFGIHAPAEVEKARLAAQKIAQAERESKAQADILARKQEEEKGAQREEANRRAAELERQKAAHPWRHIEAKLLEGTPVWEIAELRSVAEVNSLDGPLARQGEIVTQLAKRYLISHPQMAEAWNRYVELLQQREAAARLVAERQRRDYLQLFPSETVPMVRWGEPAKADAFLNRIQADWISAKAEAKRQESAQVQQAAMRQGALAHFPLNSDSNDRLGKNPAMRLTNTRFENGALFLNGDYASYSAIARVPALDYNRFTVAVDFCPVDATRERQVFLVGGSGYRWLGLLYLKGQLALSLNNQRTYFHLGAQLRPREWHTVVCSVDLAQRKILILLDGELLPPVELPADFKFEVVGSDAEQSDKAFMFTNYSNGDTFHGYVANLRVFNYAVRSSDLKIVHDLIAPDRPRLP